MRTLDKDARTLTISDDSSQAVSVDTGHDEAEHVMLTLDDGTQDNEPAQYDLTMRIDPPTGSVTSSYRFVEKWETQHARNWTWLAWPESMQVEIANRSGAQADYRVALLCVGLV